MNFSLVPVQSPPVFSGSYLLQANLPIYRNWEIKQLSKHQQLPNNHWDGICPRKEAWQYPFGQHSVWVLCSRYFSTVFGFPDANAEGSLEQTDEEFWFKVEENSKSALPHQPRPPSLHYLDISTHPVLSSLFLDTKCYSLHKAVGPFKLCSTHFELNPQFET